MTSIQLPFAGHGKRERERERERERTCPVNEFQIAMDMG
jgi:hypothetical protein